MSVVTCRTEMPLRGRKPAICPEAERLTDIPGCSSWMISANDGHLKRDARSPELRIYADAVRGWAPALENCRRSRCRVNFFVVSIRSRPERALTPGPDPQ